MHRGEIDFVEHLSPLLVLNDEARINQRREMVGKCRRRQVEMLNDVPDPEAFFPDLHQQAKDREAHVVAECGEGFGIGAAGCHVSIYNHKTGYVKIFPQKRFIGPNP